MVGVGVNRAAVAVARAAAVAVAGGKFCGLLELPLFPPLPFELPFVPGVPARVAMAVAVSTTAVAVEFSARVQAELEVLSIKPKSTTAPKVEPIVISRRGDVVARKRASLIRRVTT